MSLTKNILNDNIDYLYNNLITVVKTKDTALILKKDLRGKLFALEGILRLYLKYPRSKVSNEDQKILIKILEKFKDFEDKIGYFSLMREALEYYNNQKLNNTKLLSKIKKGIKQSDKDMIDYLNEKHWLEQLKSIQLKLNQTNFGDHELKTIKKSLKYEIKRISSKIKHQLADIIYRDQYDYLDLEEGFHEWRRMIRWVSIYIQAYKPLFELKKVHKLSKKIEKNLIKAHKNSPFSQFPISQKHKKIKIDKMKYYQLSDYIHKVGKIKSNGEMAYFFSSKFDFKVNDDSLEDKAHKIFKRYQKNKVLKKFVI